MIEVGKFGTETDVDIQLGKLGLKELTTDDYQTPKFSDQNLARVLNTDDKQVPNENMDSFSGIHQRLLGDQALKASVSQASSRNTSSGLSELIKPRKIRRKKRSSSFNNTSAQDQILVQTS